MQRPTTAKAVATAAALLILLAGCGGKDDDKGNGSSPGSGDKPADTPSAPAVASFDPPKAFSPLQAYGVLKAEGENTYTLSAGMVGQTSLVSANSGLTGRDVAGLRDPWTALSTPTPDTISTVDHTDPMPVQIDGKDAVAIAYIQNVKGNGTQKVHGQALVLWLDPTDGKKIAELTVDLSQTLGPGGGAKAFLSQSYDQATGQVALGLDADSAEADKRVGSAFTIYADPKTQKATVLPFFEAAGVLNGAVVGAKASNSEGAHDGTIVIADGASGKVGKQINTKLNYLQSAGSGTKHAYLSGSSYVENSKSAIFTYTNILYSVDIATGAVVQTKPALGTGNDYYFKCLGDQAAGVVCTTGENPGTDEIIGIDDNTGKKVWGYTKSSASRVVPYVTAAFHGVLYGVAGDQPVMMNLAGGQDIPRASSPTETPSSGTTPTDGTTPTEGSNGTPTDGSPGGNDPVSAFGSSMSFYDPKLGPPSPTAVTKYGGTYLQGALGDDLEREKILVVLKPTA